MGPQGAKPSLRLDAKISAYMHPRAKRSLFRSLSFTAFPSHITCVFGASGTGKTTLLKILLGEPSGTVTGTVIYRVDEDQLTPPSARTRGIVGALFQGDSLVPWKRIAANLTLPHHLNRRLEAPSSVSVSDMFRTLQLDLSVLAYYPHQISLGMRQRVQYARLLLYSPRFVLIDEPFLGLDPLNTDRLANSLRDYVSRTGACCVVVTHDLGIARRTADRFFYLSQSGELAAMPDDVSEKELLEAFRNDPLIGDISHSSA